LTDLLLHKRTGLRAVARLARELWRSNNCARRWPIESGLAATADNYSSFAFTRSGIAIGFDTSQAAMPACGRFTTTIPYSALRPYLNTLGHRLVASVR
jgi:hypothetical protein